jgi:hypothetical protein
MNTMVNVKSWASIDLHQVTSWVLSGVMAGSVAGLVSRISMRLIALEAGMRPGFSISGTVAILVIGAVLGIPFALLYAALRRFLPLQEKYRGLVYSVVLGVLFVGVPFIFFADGELSLVSPLLGILFFTPVPLSYSILLTFVHPKLEVKANEIGQTKQVHLLWLVLLVVVLIFSLVSMSKLIARYPLSPRVITQLYLEIGLTSTTASQLHNMLSGSYMLVYAGLALAIFWRGAHSWLAKYTSLTLLVLAGGFFTRGIFPGESMNAILLARIFPAVYRPLGWSMFFVFFYLFPDGHLQPRWARWAAIFWIAIFLVWFSGIFEGTLLDISAWPIMLQFLLLVGGLSSGVLTQIIRYLSANPEQREQTRAVVFSLVITLVLFAILWLGMAVNPDLMATIRIDKRLTYLFSFTPYLFIWLLIPLSLTYSMFRRDLWSPTVEQEQQVDSDVAGSINLSNKPEEANTQS